MADKAEKKPEILTRNGVLGVRVDTKFRMKGTPWIEASAGGEFTPSQAELSEWPHIDKAYVKVSGESNSRYRGFPLSRVFNVRGPGSYEPAPEWLEDLLRQAGYTGEFRHDARAAQTR